MRRAVLIVVAVVLVIGIWKLSHRSYAGSGGLSGALANKGNLKGAPAPGFSLTDLTGQPLVLANYRGKVVLLDFWATWCAPCREEIPHFIALQDKYREQGLEVIGISMDDGPKPVQEFYRRFKMNYPVAVGTEQVAEAYGGVYGLPVTFLLDRDGRVVAKYTGAVEMATVEQQVQSLLQAK
jgi:cytochrome c biogenesis protein CcmG, thiol:disulfide interchange protein DsbE